MKDIITQILGNIGKKLANVICCLCATLKSYFSFKKDSIEDKRQRQLLKEEKEYNKKVDKVTKDGTIEDLLDLKKTSLVILFLILAVSGCKTEVTILTTKSWEGHFKTVKEFNEATKDMKLDKKESIWVLSDRTLNRVLKNTGN